MKRRVWRQFWAERVPHNEAIFRAAGRARHNLRRQLRAELRRLRIAEVLRRDGTSPSNLSEIARQFKVSKSAACRDLAKLRGDGFNTWEPHELKDRIFEAERQLAHTYEIESTRFERQARLAPHFIPQEQRSSYIYRLDGYRQMCAPPNDSQERRQREANNYVAQNMEVLLDRMLNVPEGFRPTPSEIDLQVARLLGHPPPQANEGASRSPDRRHGIDGMEEYRRLRSQRRGLTLFEEQPRGDDW